jgi:hypothetical protein
VSNDFGLADQGRPIAGRAGRTGRGALELAVLRAENQARWVMKAFLAAALAAVLCAACAQGGTYDAGAGTGSGITMYGTIDEGVTIRK